MRLAGGMDPPNETRWAPWLDSSPWEGRFPSLGRHNQPHSNRTPRPGSPFFRRDGAALVTVARSSHANGSQWFAEQWFAEEWFAED